jgi:lysozyme
VEETMKKFIISCTITLAFSLSVFASGGLGTYAASTTMSPVGGTASLNVADISHWNDMTNTDWSTAKLNLNAIYIKATEGSTITDATADSNAKSAESVGLAFGFYGVLSPKATGANANVTDAVAQADYFYNFINQYSYSCVPILDVEGNYTILTAAQVTADVQAFSDEFKKLSGQDIMIYCNPTTANKYLTSSLSSYKLWLANPGSSPDATNVWNKYTMWQYTNSGSVNGISVKVDLDHATSGIFINSNNGGFIPSNKFSELLSRFSEFINNAFA